MTAVYWIATIIGSIVLGCAAVTALRFTLRRLFNIDERYRIKQLEQVNGFYLKRIENLEQFKRDSEAGLRRRGAGRRDVNRPHCG